MATFPVLRTGVIAQYPATRALLYRNQIVRFLDGNEQRYRDWPNPLHRWTIPLDLLDETELAAIEAFFLSNQGRFASFAFVDPWDGTSYPNCSIANDQLELRSMQELRCSVTLSITENR